MYVGVRDDLETEYHESRHIEQQLGFGYDNGWAGFYGSLMIEYIKYGFGKGNLENSAYYYGAQLSSQHNIE
jgi:hypothetical protein